MEILSMTMDAPMTASVLCAEITRLKEMKNAMMEDCKMLMAAMNSASLKNVEMAKWRSLLDKLVTMVILTLMMLVHLNVWFKMNIVGII